jgi:bifunctional DNase/RNase
VAALHSAMDAEIDAVRVAGTPQGPVPVVVLAVDDEDDVVPIFVGFEEARSIARGLDATDIGRPLTHDLLLDVMEELGGRVDRVVVSDVTEEGTYIADLHVDTPRDGVVIDARPSDSMALAARTNVPIEVDESVFEEGRQPADEFEELEDIRELREEA